MMDSILNLLRDRYFTKEDHDLFHREIAARYGYAIYGKSKYGIDALAIEDFVAKRIVAEEIIFIADGKKFRITFDDGIKAERIA